MYKRSLPISNVVNRILYLWFNIKQPVRYLLVGGYNTLFSIILFYILYHSFQNKFGYLTILVMNHLLSVLNSTINFHFFVFRAGNFFRNYIKTNITYTFYLIINAILLKVAKDILHFDVVISQIFITILLILPFYLIHKFFSFA